MDKKCMKKCLPFLAIKEMQIKTSFLLEWLPSRIQIKTNGLDVGKKNPHAPLVGMQISTTTKKNSMEAPQKTENSIAI
jgi:hypothetical protein